MNFTKRILPVVIVAALAGVSPAAWAVPQQVTNQDLLKLIKQQAAQIAQLKQRLSAVEAHEQKKQATTSSASSTASPAGRTAQRKDVANPAALRKAQLSAVHRTSAVWGNYGGASPIFTSDDGFFSFRPTGRIMMDFSTTHSSQYGERNISGSRLEAARLGAEGSVGPLGYRLAVDFRGGSAHLRQAYLSYTTRLFGHDKTRFYLGNVLKDIGTEGSSQSASVPFMIRNAAVTVGEPVNGFFGMGVQMRTYGDNWHYSLSVTGDTPDDSSSEASDSVAYVTRAHWNPIKTGAGFLHVGGWYWYENISPEVTKINDTPEIAVKFNGNLHVSASSIDDPTHDHAAGLELGGVYRNFWVMSEVAKRTIDTQNDGAISRHGSSLAGGWVITGEKTGFSSASGTWRWLHVNRPVTSGGPGAFELVGRVDRYDYSDAPRGGVGQSYTVGLNWYLNEWSRLMLDVIRWHTDNQVSHEKGSDWGNTLGLRAQLRF